MKKNEFDYVWTDKKRTLFGWPLSFTRYFLTETKFITRTGFLSVDEDEVTTEANIQDDLGADSLDVVDLITTIEDEFDISIPDEAVEEIKTVGDIVNYIEKNTDAE